MLTYADVWRTLIRVPFESQDVGAWMRLHVLLDRIMIRAAKADMETLGKIPTCQYHDRVRAVKAREEGLQRTFDDNKAQSGAF